MDLIRIDETPKIVDQLNFDEDNIMEMDFNIVPS